MSRAVRLTAVRGAPAHDAEQVTQLVAGEGVVVRERTDDGWVRVVVPGQASSLDPDGYPGWVVADDLGDDAAALLAVARTYLGVPYVWGGMSHDGIDCSGLVVMSLRALGVVVPRDAHDQADALPAVRLGDERPGDLWFFARPGARVHHVGFVAAPGVMLHAPESGKLVVEEPLGPDRQDTLVSAARVLP